MIEDWSAGATIGGRPIPALPDMERLRAERFAKIQDQLEAQNIDGLVLLGSAGVAHTTGADAPGEDAGKAGLFRAVSVVIAGESAPHLYTPFLDGVPPEFPADHVHGPLFPDLDDGIHEFVDALNGYFPVRRPPRRRRADPPDAACAGAISMERRERRAGCGQDPQDAGRGLGHPRGATDHRAGDGERPRGAAARACARPS